jgi:multicomponent K+:H+ antiporter subunit C
LTIAAAPILQKGADVPYADPLPQALALTAIVISFGMTAVVVMIALGAYLGANDDHINDPPEPPTEGETQ